MRYILTFSLLISIINLCQAQSAFAPLNQDYYHLIDRYEIKQKSLSKFFFTSVKPYNRHTIAAFADSLLRQTDGYSKQDNFNLQYLANDNWEYSQEQKNDSKKPVFKKFYRKQSDLFHVEEKDFDLHVNPVLVFAGGTDNQLESTLFTNTRGLEIRGRITEKLAFYTFFSENQIRFPFYVQQETRKQGVVPGEGFTKAYATDARDFFTARGYIQMPLIKEYVSMQFGHDRNFIGNGYRSLILSDHANNYLFLKLSTKIWRFQYTNLFTKMATTDDVSGQGNPIPKKYMAFHHLSLNITDNFNIGIFESIVYGRPDSLNNGIDLNYLNPIIFYRSIEHETGDNGNAILGMDFKWNAFKGIQFYGQAVIDEMIVGEFIGGDGWWGNKQAAQLGLKYIDVAKINNLDLQLEWNLVRPYTYTHFNEESFSNYQHYSQPLAHPLGANFREIAAIVRYQPTARLMLTAKGIFTKIGYDPNGENWGSNIFLDYNTREMDYGNETGQGAPSNIQFFDLTASYQLRHNMFIDLKQTIRNSDSTLPQFNFNNSATIFTFRWNMPQRLFEF